MKNAKKLILVLVMLLSLVCPAATVAAAGPQELDIGDLPEWEMRLSSQSGRLLFSDSPEMVNRDGILYRDQVEGAGRLFFHHVNADAVAKRLEVLVENKSSKVARVAVRQYGLGGPGYAWMAIGKETLTSYLAGSQPYELAIPPGGAVPLSAVISETAVLPNMLISGMFDFTADRPVTVTVLMLPLLEDGAAFARTARVLAPDEYHLRGTFEGADRKLVAASPYDPAEDGPVALTLGDNQIDRYLTGVDATNGKPVINYGNYGVVYQLVIPSKSGGKIAYYLAPRGGEYAGAIGIDHPDATWRSVATPMGRVHFGTNRAEDFAFLGTYDSGETMVFTFSPPGASNLPVKIVVLPQ